LPSQCIDGYITTTKRMNRATARVYRLRLKNFDVFSVQEYSANIDNLINLMKNGSVDPYQLLNKYVSYLQFHHNLSPLTLKQEVITAKNLLEYYDVDISPRKFKLKVKLPKVIRKNKQALSKEDVINILNSCSDIRLKTYVLLLAATGMRAVEALSIRIKDIDFESSPAQVFLRGEFTKTRAERTVVLTEEVAKHLTTWIDYKYRARRVSYSDKAKAKSVTEIRTPQKNKYDLLFAVYQSPSSPNPNNIYVDLRTGFSNTLDRIGMGGKEEFINNTHSDKRHRGRRRITLHSFRRYVKSTISDLGYGDFSEYYIGHSTVSTYYRKTDKEKIELFRKIEPHLTFLDYPTLERKGADVEAKVENLEQENQRLRHSDQLKEDALATLSDQVMKLMVEVQELKQR
jgi:integrase